jgi:hypothetical protein
MSRPAAEPAEVRKPIASRLARYPPGRVFVPHRKAPAAVPRAWPRSAARSS